MKLILVRHGDAVHGAIDPERPLTNVGRETIRNLGAFFEAQGVSVKEIWHSYKVRARETAEIIVSGLSLDLVPQERAGLAPEDPVEPIVSAIEDSKEDLMIVGHLPFLQILAVRLLTDGNHQAGIGFSQGKAYCLERNKKGEWGLVFESPDF